MANKTKADIEAENKKLKKENKDTKKNYDELYDKFDKLEEMMKALLDTKNETTDVEPKEEVVVEYKDDNSPIAPNEYVRVTSLCKGKLNLTTKRNGGGTIFRFVSFGQTKNITYQNLEEIVNNNRSFAEKGYYYIQNKKAVRDLMLEEYYENLLDDDAIKSLLEGKNSNMVEVFSIANQTQKEQIVGLLIKHVVNGGKSDRNQLYAISGIYGRDIAAMIEDAKYYKTK